MQASGAAGGAEGAVQRLRGDAARAAHTPAQLLVAHPASAGEAKKCEWFETSAAHAARLFCTSSAETRYLKGPDGSNII